MRTLTLAVVLAMFSAGMTHAEGMQASTRQEIAPPAVLAATAGEPNNHRVLPLLLLAGIGLIALMGSVGD
jgi:hypothetical protein